MVKAFVGKVSLYRKSFIQRFRLKSDGADDAKPEAKKTLRKENTETFALFRRKKSKGKNPLRQEHVNNLGLYSGGSLGRLLLKTETLS